ncbi:MAG: Methionyl-tRNA formyltransferase [Bogoriella megaspora]|nr:MAG: Methionyl-tRNA formyltransferase [Bogoriella megaspora]
MNLLCRVGFNKYLLPYSSNKLRRFSSRSGVVHDPLRILFCGSDAFSIASLEALNRDRKHRPGSSSSIDVVCRPGKRVGRGLKAIREVPIKKAAQDIGLPIHEIDTFKGWQPPAPQGQPINLVIAVSFGLFIPARILSNAKYGGLNAHPSLLPDLWGPAPLHHTLLQRRSVTGVTIQTLHPKHFDQGAILAQTPPPGIPIPNPETCVPDDLLDLLAPIGGSMLVDSIAKGRFLTPHQSCKPFTGLPESAELHHARKIASQDRHIDWRTWTSDEILLRQRVLGNLWDDVTYDQCSQLSQAKPTRVLYHGWEILDQSSQRVISDETYASPSYTLESEASLKSFRGAHILLAAESGNCEPALGFVTADSKVIRPTSATIEGKPRGEGVSELVNLAKRKGSGL